MAEAEAQSTYRQKMIKATSVIYNPIIKLPENVGLDIVGDVHGEIDSFTQLLAELGYSIGSKPQDRHLVLVGDIVDRGPNSYAVFKIVKQLVESGAATLILGNHESNILRQDLKDGGGWFFNIKEGNERKYLPCYFPSDAEKEEIKSFLKMQPVAAFRSDIRVVHACWDSAAIETLVSCTGYTDFIEMYKALDTQKIELSKDLEIDYAFEQKAWGNLLKTGPANMPYLKATAEYKLQKQMKNPVRVINSGPECHLDPGELPFFVGGEWRMIKRKDWWLSYTEEIPVVMGHYWREPPFIIQEGLPLIEFFKDKKFTAESPVSWFGPNKNVFCVDYSVGKQFTNRENGVGTKLGHKAKLAALKWPERVIVFDCGIMFKTTK